MSDGEYISLEKSIDRVERMIRAKKVILIVIIIYWNREDLSLSFWSCRENEMLVKFEGQYIEIDKYRENDY